MKFLIEWITLYQLPGFGNAGLKPGFEHYRSGYKIIIADSATAAVSAFATSIQTVIHNMKIVSIESVNNMEGYTDCIFYYTTDSLYSPGPRPIYIIFFNIYRLYDLEQYAKLKSGQNRDYFIRWDFETIDMHLPDKYKSGSKIIRGKNGMSDIGIVKVFTESFSNVVPGLQFSYKAGSFDSMFMMTRSYPPDVKLGVMIYLYLNAQGIEQIR